MSRSHVRLLCISVTAVTLALLAAPWTASAEDDSRVGRSYAGIGFGYGFENFDRDDASNVDDAAGVEIWFGYRISEFWATETQVEYMRGFDLTIAGLDGDGDYLTTTVNAKVFPFARLLPRRIEPFAFAGAGVGWFQVSLRTNDDIDDVAFLIRAGGGVDFYVLEDLALQFSTSYVHPTSGLSNFAYVSMVTGLQYRF